jgi:hypothetical protein
MGVSLGCLKQKYFCVLPLEEDRLKIDISVGEKKFR